MIGTSVFLIPNGTFFVEVLVVLVILFLVTKYILPPLNRAMESRQQKIRESLEEADRVRAEASAAADERTQLLNEAREQAREIVQSAQAMSDQVRSEAAGRAQAEYDRILANAQIEVEAARLRAIDEASARVGEIVFDLVEKVVGREVDQSAHQSLVDEAVATLHREAGQGIAR